MQRSSIVVVFAFVAALVGAMSVTPSAQTQTKTVTDEDYPKIMKQVGPTWQSFNANTKAMKHEDAAKDAEKLIPLFKDVQVYWEAKKVDDAIGFAKSTLTGLDAIVKAGSNMEAIAAGQKQVMCAACHMAHREKLPEGGFKIK